MISEITKTNACSISSVTFEFSVRPKAYRNGRQDGANDSMFEYLVLSVNLVNARKERTYMLHLFSNTPCVPCKFNDRSLRLAGTMVAKGVIYFSLAKANPG